MLTILTLHMFITQPEPYVHNPNLTTLTLWPCAPILNPITPTLIFSRMLTCLCYYAHDSNPIDLAHNPNPMTLCIQPYRPMFTTLTL